MPLISGIYGCVPNKPLGHSTLTTKEKRGMALRMRKNPTPPEAIMWERLRALKSVGVYFTPQVLLSGWIVDFYCGQHKLIVEIDGKVHNRLRNKLRDKERDAVLASKGFIILRIKAKVVFKNPTKAFDSICKKIGVQSRNLKPTSRGTEDAHECSIP